MPSHGVILRQNVVNFWQSVLYYTTNEINTTYCKKNSCDNGTMKPLLRKIFFWDEPAQGAFFGLTLLVTLPRFFLTIGYDVILPLFMQGDSRRSMALYLVGGLAILLFGALLYALVLFRHLLPQRRLAKVVFIAIFCVYVVLMVVFWDFVPTGYERLWIFSPVVFVVFSVIYMLYPAGKLRDWLYAVGPLALGWAALCYNSVLNARALSVPVLMKLPLHGMSVSTGGSPWLMWTLTVLGILLLGLSYLLWGRLIAKLGGLTVRSLFGRGVVTLWLIFAFLYLVSAVMALDAEHEYRNARARLLYRQRELDAYWEMSVNPQTLEEKYTQSGRIDQSFWDELVALDVGFTALNEQYDGIDVIVGFHNAVLPPEIYEQWKSAFAESPELLRMEQMLDERLPLPERKYVLEHANLYEAILSKCRSMTRLELWRVRLALEGNDILSAQKALQRIDNISAFLQHDYSLTAGLVWMAIEQMRSLVLSQILASGLSDEQWLRGQEDFLQQKESTAHAVYQRLILGEAANMLHVIDTCEQQTSLSQFLIFPEACYFYAREGASLARCFFISDFADFPEKPTGIFAGMLAPALRLTGTKMFPKLIATLRISRGMIAAESMRFRNGRYPDTLDDLPIDPFSGDGPLKYAVGEVEIVEKHFQPNENPSPIGITPELQKQLGLTDEQAAEFSRPRKYVFETEWRTVDAVQIWSVGPDGIDDGGLRSTDDIRFVIPIQGKP